MTTLGNPIVFRSKGYVIYQSVSGDLSYGYHLIPAEQVHHDSLGIGLAFSDLKTAKKWLDAASKIGWKKVCDKWDKEDMREAFHSKYLTKKQAKPYLKWAYGEVADRYRKELGIKKSERI